MQPKNLKKVNFSHLSIIFIPASVVFREIAYWEGKKIGSCWPIWLIRDCGKSMECNIVRPFVL